MSVMKYIERSIEPVVKRAAREFPVVVVTGPRQSGKTVLMKKLKKGNYSAAYLRNLES